MRRSRFWTVAAAALLMVSTAACTRLSGGQVAGQTGSPTESAATSAPLVTPSATRTRAPTPTPEPTPRMDPVEPAFAPFDPGNFNNSTEIDNAWMPLTPGRQWVVEGVTIEGGERIPHRINFTVTDLTKEIQGVRTVVAWVEDYSDGELVEKEIAFYAQDDDGAVWYLGEHPEEYEGGEFVAAPTWIAGAKNARPGIKVVADPQVEMQTYYQGWAPAVKWSDYGRVDAVDLDDCVAVGCYQGVLRIAESSLDEEGVFQLKSYARGVGEIRVGWRGDAESREELELVLVRTLSPDNLAKIRAAALSLEAHAYEVSPDEYALTEPSQWAQQAQ